VASIETAKQITLNNILYLTDFSELAKAALPFVTAIAHKYGEFTDIVNEGLEQAANSKI
jgi:hypothetical protein